MSEDKVFLECSDINRAGWFDLEDVAALGTAGAMSHEFGCHHAAALQYADILATDSEGPLIRCFVGNHGGVDWAGYFEVAEYCEGTGTKPGAVAAYIDMAGQFDQFDFEDSYAGAYPYMVDVNNYLVELFLEYSEIPAHLAGYLDEERIARDMMFDHYWSDGYLFRRC